MNASSIDTKRTSFSDVFDEKLFQATIESVKDGILVVDYNGQILYWNQQFVDMWEVPPEILTNRNDEGLLKFLATRIKNADTFVTKILQLYESPEKDFDTIIFKDGKVFERFSAPLMFDESITGRVWSFKDVTAKKRLEAQLAQAQKMEAIGTLASGIAHNFNNILMVIQGCTSLLLMREPDQEQRQNLLKEIQTHIRTAADLNQQLLGFAGKGICSSQRIDLKALIKGSSDLFSREKPNLIITASYDDPLWAIEADPSQIEKVILHLLLNAWQAMPTGGTIFMDVKNWIITESEQEEYQLAPGKYIKIGITDTGEGMDAATQKRIFEPFYSSHKLGRGSGIGLANVYGIIKNHGGNIQVRSTLEKGTQFSVLLPVRLDNPKTNANENAIIMNGTETILIVDDEEMVLDVGTAMLTKMGYKVLIAESGSEALNLFEKQSQAIDLVILDMMMPQMNGKEIHDRLKKIKPDVKVILSSGYNLNDQASEIMECGCIDFIQKPFNMAHLSQTVSDALKN